MTTAATLPEPDVRSGRRRRRRRRELDPRRNSLNMFRLILAALVLVSHAHALAGLPEPTWQGRHLGTWAVAGFFVLSGYLITASRLRTHMAEFLVHRIARIFPAFLMCLVVTVVVVAPLGFLQVHGTIDGYLTTPNTPLNYLFSSMMLEMGDYSIAGTPSGIPFPGAWNGSLWSLYYEFLCYLILGVLALIPIAKRSPWPLTIAFALSVLAYANLPTVLSYFGGSVQVSLLLELLPYFLGGAMVYLLRTRIPLNPLVGVLSAAGWVALVIVEPTWGGQLGAPLITVALLWLASVIPSPDVLRRHDVSYGVYIYTFPIQQLLAHTGLHEHMILYLVTTALLVLIPATLSWLYLERPVMRHVRTYDTNRVRQIAQEEPAI